MTFDQRPHGHIADQVAAAARDESGNVRLVPGYMGSCTPRCPGCGATAAECHGTGVYGARCCPACADALAAGRHHHMPDPATFRAAILAARGGAPDAPAGA